ncbi:unnamed protein product [Paramecium primaurelia]|uniref:Uncharacterized protein n=1 Tax=Paramecium primaurelia TaxID=5886 RepID=A0A8S1NH56_PARPR|nr:unnamed protein product [Paramecium primaurelia]
MNYQLNLFFELNNITFHLIQESKVFIEQKNSQSGMDQSKQKIFQILKKLYQQLRRSQIGCLFQLTVFKIHDINVEYLHQTTYLILLPCTAQLGQGFGEIKRLVSQINSWTYIFIQQNYLITHQIIRFSNPFFNQLIQYQGIIRNGNPYKTFLSQQNEEFKSVKTKRLQILYFPDYGYLESFNLVKRSKIEV